MQGLLMRLQHIDNARGFDMLGIETAFWGVLGNAPELKTSRSGKPFAQMSIVVAVGQDEDGKDLSQWLRVACFGETAERLAHQARKGDRVYVEGNLTLNSWADKATGEPRTALNVAAWKCERVANIGQNRERKNSEQPQRKSTQWQPVESNRFAFNDEIGF
jgi:single-strand DNA-binding protein